MAVGTDSLASAPDLNVFAELATMRALAPTVSPGALLDSATRQGAHALGFDADYGTIEPGKSARLLAVALRRAPSMWKNTWCPESSATRYAGLMNYENSDFRLCRADATEPLQSEINLNSEI